VWMCAPWDEAKALSAEMGSTPMGDYGTLPPVELLSTSRLVKERGDWKVTAVLWVMSLRPNFAHHLRHLRHSAGAGQPLAGYLTGSGHFFAGAVTLITAEVFQLTFVERLFQLNRTKRLSLPVFAWGYRYWRHMMDVVESMEVWKASRRLA
jgi:hypothetical protein